MKTQQQISPSIKVLLFKPVELDRNNNFESDTIGFQVSDRFGILEKVSDSVGFGFTIRRICISRLGQFINLLCKF